MHTKNLSVTLFKKNYQRQAKENAGHVQFKLVLKFEIKSHLTE